MLDLKISKESEKDAMTGEISAHFNARLRLFVQKYNPDWPHRTLVLEQFQGKFLKPCPCTGGEYYCCGYNVLNNALNCTFGCDYCILQAYLEEPRLVFYTNWEEMQEQLEQTALLFPKRKYRIGTGELSDSLYLDPITHFSRAIVPFFGLQKNMIVELKSKSPYIDNLEELDHRGHSVIAWSLAPEYVIKRHEVWASSLEQRLQAAKQVTQWGYPVAFHFDPIINYHDWKSGYASVVDELFSAVDPANIVWISLGAFRFTKKLAQIMTQDKRKASLLHQEFILCPDGKYRYFWKIRAEMFHFIASRIREYAPDVLLYLCMESKKLWKEGLGWVPHSNEQISDMLDNAVFSRASR